MKLFVYGTLKRGKSAHHLLNGCKFLGSTSLEDYSLCGSSPAIKPNIGGWVDGELYEIPDYDNGPTNPHHGGKIPILMNLDNYEGYLGPGKDNLYERTKVDVSHQIAYAYVFNGAYEGELVNGEW